MSEFFSSQIMKTFFLDDSFLLSHTNYRNVAMDMSKAVWSTLSNSFPSQFWKELRNYKALKPTEKHQNSAPRHVEWTFANFVAKNLSLTLKVSVQNSNKFCNYKVHELKNFFSKTSSGHIYRNFNKALTKSWQLVRKISA